MGSISSADIDGFVLAEAIPEDFDALARLQAVALKTDPFFKILMKDIKQEDFDAFMRQLLEVRLERPKATTFKITETGTGYVPPTSN